MKMNFDTNLPLLPYKMPPFQDDIIIENCNDLLLHRRFDECLKICEGCLQELKNRTELPRAGDLTESFCILTIQSLAELNRWQEVVPHITQVYNGIEDVPEKIIQACILLHNEVQDFPTCGVLANIWLRNPSNRARPEFLLVLNTYLFRVLLPLSHWDEMLATVDVCKGLDKANAENYKQQINSLKEQTELENIQTLAEESTLNNERQENREERQPGQMSSKSKSDNSTYSVGPLTYFRAFITKIIQWVRSRIPVPVAELQRLQSIALFATITYLLVNRANIDSLPYKTLASIWSALGRLWKSMFSPYHVARID